MELQNRANEITRIMQAYGSQGALKAVMSRLGLDCGSLRLPNLPLPEIQWQGLYLELNDAGFFERIQM